MTSWYDSLAFCVGDRHAYEILEIVHETGLAALGAGHGLTAAEVASVYAYTTGREFQGLAVFERINQCLRFPALHAHDRALIDPLIYCLISALQGLPAYEGHVFRRTDLPGDVVTEAMNGRFSDAGFLSCSENADIFEGNDLLILRSSSSRPISAFSCHPSEKEVVFLPNTPFEVTRLDRMGSSVILVGYEVSQ